MFIDITPIACSHIHAYYQWMWENHKCIAFNLLRRGYLQCSAGRIETEVGGLAANNLY